MTRARSRVRLSEQVFDFVRSQPPESRRRLRLALRALDGEQGDIKPLEGALAGYYRLRLGAYRIVFRYGPTPRGGRGIYCVFAERRSVVYLLLEDLLSRGLSRREDE